MIVILATVPDDGHHGEGKHDERDVTVPAIPGAGFVVVETEFVFGSFETFLDGPAIAFDRQVSLPNDMVLPILLLSIIVRDGVPGCRFRPAIA